ncbi:MAG TPA: sugar ABC transporter substrate-binding protein [Chloroflexota bacterium]|nr:sugar ABC transporter substrate-binding protein [Chloroflexota bacterium]
MQAVVSRRSVLAGGGMAAAGLLAVACGPGAQSDGALKASGPVSGPIELMWSNETTTLEFLEQDWIPSFKREHPQADVTLAVVPGSWDDLYQKIQVTNAAGTAPSLTRGKDYFTGDMASLGLVEPLDRWLKGQQDVTAEQYLPAIWGNVIYKGTVIGLPLYSFVRPLYYNVALFREAGLVDNAGKPLVADTWQQYAQFARQLTQPSKGIWGTQIYSYSGEDATTAWVNYLIQCGGQLINDERTRYTFNSGAGIEALQFFVDLIVKDRACRGPQDTVPDGVRKIAMWNAVGNGAYNNYPKNMPDLEYTLTLVPKNKNRGVIARGQGLYLMKNGKNKEGAWAFMRFASRDENSHTFTQAIRLGPVKTVNFAKEPYVSDPEWKVNLDQYRIKENVYQPIYGGYTEGAKVIAEELIAAYNGEKTAKDALTDAHRRATEFLKP